MSFQERNNKDHKTKRLVHVVGGGLAGSEAAYFLAEAGVEVILHEMRPKVKTPAHQTDRFAELVCSNSLKSRLSSSAPGILKAEMGVLQSLIIRSAGAAAIPGGNALVVDRNLFSENVNRALRTHPNIQCRSGEEVTAPFAEGVTLFATGPLTSPALSNWILKASGPTGEDGLYFYDAIAPVVDAASIDMQKAFKANRYDEGGEDAYLNCPFNEEEYGRFYDALMAAEKVPPQRFEEEKLFQGCQPIESIAATGRNTLRFGPMKPVGLHDPKQTARHAFYAVVQLRPENRSGTAYNLVGFQTKLKHHEQPRVFRLIPGLENAEFIRFGSIHRNTYVCAPSVLRPDLSLRKHPTVYLAGQLTGVEGYLESAACGLLAAIFILQRLRGQPHNAPPANTALGALLRHVIGSEPEQYQPSNIHFGLFDPAFFENLAGENVAKMKRDELRKEISKQALANFQKWAAVHAK